MREVRQIRQPDHFSARHHVQGIRLVYHRLFGQDETADRRHIKTDADRNDHSAIRVVGIGRSPSDDLYVVAGNRNHYTVFRRDDQFLDVLYRQRTRIRHKHQVDNLR